MKELTKAFNGTTIPIEIIDDENMYFTISAIARDNGKNITEWKNSKRVKELVRSLDKSNGIKGNLIAEDSQGRTKIHNSLFVNFARFVSVDFEIVSNKIIMDILLGEKIICDRKFEVLTNQLQLSQAETKKAQSNKMKTYRNDRVALRKYLSDNEIDLSEESAWLKLLDEEIISVRDHTTLRKFLNNSYYGVQEGAGTIEFNSRALDDVFSDYVKRDATLF